MSKVLTVDKIIVEREISKDKNGKEIKKVISKKIVSKGRRINADDVNKANAWIDNTSAKVGYIYAESVND